MKKKLRKWNRKCGIFMVVWLAVLLTACGGSRQERGESMVIKPSEFSEETQEVVKILDDEIAFFDYSVDETIKSMSVDIWIYENGEWVNGGNTLGNLKRRDGRIAVRINDASYDIFDMNEDGHVKMSYKSIVDFQKSQTQTGSRLSNAEKIEAGTEISLWVRLGFDAGKEIRSGGGRDFRKSDCDSGLAVTVTFSAEEVE